MTWFTGLVAFILVWWLVLFAVLPWGIRHDMKFASPDERSPGSPLNPNLLRKFLITSIIAVLIWLVIYFALQANILDPRSISLQMMEEVNE